MLPPGRIAGEGTNGAVLRLHKTGGELFAPACFKLLYAIGRRPFGTDRTRGIGPPKLAVRAWFLLTTGRELDLMVRLETCQWTSTGYCGDRAGVAWHRCPEELSRLQTLYRNLGQGDSTT